MAAVFPAQPDPMMMTSLITYLVFVAGSGLLVHRIAAAHELPTKSYKLRRPRQVIRDQAADIRKDGHVRELNCRPAPPPGLPAHNGDRGHALHGKREEDEKREGAPQTQLALKGGAQPFGLGRPVHAINSSQRSDDDFAGGDRGNQPDPDLPVEPQRLDRRLDCMADHARVAVADRRGFAVLQRQVSQGPKRDYNHQDHSAGAPQEHFGAIVEPQAERSEGRETVWRHLEYKGRSL